MTSAIDILFDYVRLVAYAVIILLALHGIAKKKFNNVYFVGDIVMALGLLLAGFHVNVLGKSGANFGDVILTPAAVIWAGIHFALFLKEFKGYDT